jgi:hypothetical protein
MGTNGLYRSGILSASVAVGGCPIVTKRKISVEAVPHESLRIIKPYLFYPHDYLRQFSRLVGICLLTYHLQATDLAIQTGR